MIVFFVTTEGYGYSFTASVAFTLVTVCSSFERRMHQIKSIQCFMTDETCSTTRGIPSEMLTAAAYGGMMKAASEGV